MQTQLKFQYPYPQNQTQVWKPFKYVLPENPSDAYKMYDKDTIYNMKATEKCPFPRIRQLLMVISQTTQTDMDLQFPDLLRQKYYSNPQDRQLDRQLNSLLTRGQDASQKLGQILKCLVRYNELYNNVRDSLGDQFSQKIREIQNKIQSNKQKMRITEMKIKQKGRNRNQFNSMSGIMSDNNPNRGSEMDNAQNINKKQEIEELRRLENQRIQIYMENQKHYKETNKNLLEIQNDYFTFVNYSQELQRALTTASVFQLRNSRENNQFIKNSAKVDGTNEVEGKIKKLNRQLDEKIKKGIQGLFHWRQKVKSSRPTQRDKEEIRRLQQSIKEQLIKADNVFILINQMDQIFEKDKKSNRVAYVKANQLYRDFIPGYIEAKEVNEVNLRRKQYLNVIRQEKMRLKKHLQDNLGLIVPYSESEQYQKLISPLKEKRESENKNYLHLLFKEENQALELGIQFINEQYEKLYKMACGREHNAKKNVHKWVQKFKQYEKKGQNNINSEESDDQNSFFYILEESCRKLLWMLK